MGLLDRAVELGGRENGLAVVVAFRADGTPYASVVNAGVIDHPLTGERVVAFVSRRGARKLANIRRHPRVTVVFRSGWDWFAVEGDCELAGPEDPLAGLELVHTQALIRQIYAAALGGRPDDWSELEVAFAEEGHTAVLVTAIRIYSGHP